MHKFKVTSPEAIRRLLEKNPEDVTELTLNVRNPEEFMADLLTCLEADDDWPVAVAPAFIVDPTDPEQVELRAKNIVEEMVEQDVFGLNFLDFGCGNGSVAKQISERGAKKVVAYDIKKSEDWTTDGKILFTDVWKEVADNAPYDSMLVYDVLDHVMDREPRDVLADLAKLLTKDGFITVRFHPWVSRHGSHLYTKLNKAFAHLLFPEEELKKLGYEGWSTRRVINPMWSYKNWISKAGLSVVKEKVSQEPVEEFFLKNELFMSIIKKHYKNSPLEEYREGNGDWGRVLSFHFCDFILAR